MTQSKQNETCINLDELDIDLTDMSTSTITVSMPDYSAGDIYIDSHTMDSSYTIDTSSIFTSDTINLDNLTIYQPTEFEDEMPSVAKVEDMCKEYPALEKAYENFKTIYKMVHQDWQGKQDDDNGQFPF